jgi:hypothetical protein
LCFLLLTLTLGPMVRIWATAELGQANEVSSSSRPSTSAQNLCWKVGDPAKVREQIKASGARIHRASKTILDGLEAQKSAELVAEPEAVQDYEPEMEMA